MTFVVIYDAYTAEAKENKDLQRPEVLSNLVNYEKAFHIEKTWKELMREADLSSNKQFEKHKTKIEWVRKLFVKE